MEEVFQICAQLKDIEPKIYRRFNILGTQKVSYLAYCLMTMFEMNDFREYCFVVFGKEGKKLHYEGGQNGHFAYPAQCIDATKVFVSELLPSEFFKAVFWYDTKDRWQVEVTVEGKYPLEGSLSQPCLVLDGQCRGIIEEIGGNEGLNKYWKAIKENNREFLRDYEFWMDGSLVKPEKFDLGEMNDRLSKIPNLLSFIVEEGGEVNDKDLAYIYHSNF